MLGATTGFINIFDVDATTMTIDQVTTQADIEEYGIFTYEEFAELIPVPELVFDAFNGKYLKVSIGKGLITIEEIGELFERYASFFDVETEEEIEETIIESGNNSPIVQKENSLEPQGFKRVSLGGQMVVASEPF